MILLSSPPGTSYRKRGEAPTREGFYTKFQLTDTDPLAGTFQGYASVFNRPIDTFPPTVMDRGAFTKTLNESRSRVRILWNHDPSKVIGKPLELREDAHGLFLRAQIAQTALGRDALELLRLQAVDEMSVGFDPVRWTMRPDANNPGQQIRHLQEVRLWEVSIVAFAADASAVIQVVHARRADRRNLVAEMQTQNAAMVREQLRRQLIDLQLAELELLASRAKS